MRAQLCLTPQSALADKNSLQTFSVIRFVAIFILAVTFAVLLHEVLKCLSFDAHVRNVDG